MNRLPQSRHILNARTWPTVWRPEDADPIERPAKRARVADIALAVVVGVVFAVWLAEALV